MSPFKAALIIYVASLVALFFLVTPLAAIAIWLLVGSHSLIVLYTLDRKGIIKL